MGLAVEISSLGGTMDDHSKVRVSREGWDRSSRGEHLSEILGASRAVSRMKNDGQKGASNTYSNF